MKDVEVIIKHNKLKREVYSFYLENQYHLWLDEYKLENRKTTRHKWIAQITYNRLDFRYSNILEKEVLLTDEIKQKAKNNLIKCLT